MLERQETSEEDSIQGNSGIDKNEGWICHDTSSSPPPEMGEINSLIERMVQARISDVLKENKELKEKLQEMARVSEENRRLRDAIADTSLLAHEYKIKYKQAQETISAYESGNQKLPDNGCFFLCSTKSFAPGTSPEFIKYFFLNLLSLAQIKDTEGKWLIDCAAAVIPIYLVVSNERKNNKYHYKGCLKSFCNEWNCNVVANISNKERAQKLTCKYKSIVTQINRAPYKGSSPVSWHNLLDKGQNEIILGRAIDINYQLEKMFA